MNVNEWPAWLQRRLARLLLQHDQGLLRSQFRTFFVESEMPQIPLLQQYDRYIRLALLSDELLDDIMPRIRRQLALQTDHARLLEEAPTRGAIDWQRTALHALRDTPGLAPTRFATRLRQRSTTTPENLLTVALLLAYRGELRRAQQEEMGDEALSEQERLLLAGADERAERELAAPYARDLVEAASRSEIDALIEQVTARLRPGPNPYRDLIDWWQRWQRFTAARGGEAIHPALASRHEDEKVDAWLYELWIALELVHFLYERQAIHPGDTAIERDRLGFTFTWRGRRFRFRYNRQREESSGDDAAWEHGPASRPDYTIERENILQVRHEGRLIWREPPFVMDAKYYLAGSDPARTHNPIKKLLGDMALLDAEQGALFFPLLPEPSVNEQVTRTVTRRPERHHAGRMVDVSIQLYHISPELPLEVLHERLSALLDYVNTCLPERPEPVCEGLWLDPDTLHAAASPVPEQTILCPKRHIGANVFDLVDAEKDCNKNPLVCHVIGQGIVRPEIVRVTTKEGLHRKGADLRRRNYEQLRQAEEAGNDAKAEQMRTQIFNGVGGAVEQYVRLRGNTQPIADKFKWIFGADYWEQGPRALAVETRNMLLSGEYVWYEYSEAALHDWAAPAIQYCRALEFEVRRRIYKHHPAPRKGDPPDPSAFKVNAAGWTLGSLLALYYQRNAPKGDFAHNWAILQGVLAQAGCDKDEFLTLLRRIVNERVVEHRNLLAHGEPVAQDIAKALRSAITGEGGQQPGILCWLSSHLDPVI